MASVLEYLFVCGGVYLIHWLLNVHARRKAGPQLAMLGQARATGEPLSCDVPALLCLSRPGQRFARYAYGTVHVRPASVSWESRSRRHQVIRDLTGATLLGESSQAPFLKYDYVKAYEIELRSGELLAEIRLRRPLAPLVTAGLEQAGRTAAATATDSS
jgi:hypothetical protein